jgi:hypothetical protein
MAGRSRPKDGVLSHAFGPIIPLAPLDRHGRARPGHPRFAVARPQDVDARHIGVQCTPSFRTAVAGHDAEGASSAFNQTRAFPIHFSNSLSQRSAALFLCGAGYAVVLLFVPQKMRGMARQRAQPLFFVCPHSLSEMRGAARRATRTSLRSPGSFAASSLRRRAALFVAARETRDGLRQPAPGGRLLLAARRSPGAARVRALRGTPAGAASCSTIRRL